jgi:hypothetical protein
MIPLLSFSSSGSFDRSIDSSSIDSFSNKLTSLTAPIRQVALDKEEGFVKHIFGKEILGGAQAPRKRPKSGRVL